MAGTSSEQPETRICPILHKAGRGKCRKPRTELSPNHVKESCQIADKAMVSATDIRVAGPVGDGISRDHLQYCQERQTRWGHTIPQLPSPSQAQETAICRTRISQTGSAYTERPHWGRTAPDLVISRWIQVGKVNARGAIVTITERKTNYLMMKTDSWQNAKELAKNVVAMLLPYRHFLRDHYHRQRVWVC